jgi:lipid II isoglutaminyl synthase (glutamine-hydrolysing)
VTGASGIIIGLLLPDVLGTYADRGNATVLAQRLRWRGIPADIVEVTADRTAPLTCDIYVLGGGEDASQSFAAAWVKQSPGLISTLQSAQVVAVCAGFQVLGRELVLPGGRRIPGIGLIDAVTFPGGRRAVGEVAAEGCVPGLGTLTGFENHRGLTRLGPAAAPLGRLRRGTGNGDGTDGVLGPGLVATYLHGPVLARNPALADLVLRRATGSDALPPLDVPEEQAVRAAHLRSATDRRLTSGGRNLAALLHARRWGR